MVEKEYPGLTAKKYCDPSHNSKIEFLCTEDGTLCCAECAASHSDHFYKVEDIKSIFEAQLVNYRKIKSRIAILSKMPNSKDEIKSYIGYLLESSFDQLISQIMEMKDNWIEENFKRIMEALNVEVDQNTPDLTILSIEVEETFKKIQNYINSDDINSENVMNLPLPEEFEPKIEQLLQSSNKRKKYQDVTINLNFDSEPIKKMFNIKGCSLSRIAQYEGSLLNSSDLNFTLSLFPTPVKQLKMLFSGQRDGMTSSIFHSKCDGIEDTMTIFKGNGHIFGGYARPKWRSNGIYISDTTNSNFLFTCRNKTKHSLKTPQCAMRGGSSHGPTFGEGKDIYIDSTGTKGYNNINHSYSIPSGGNRDDYLSGNNTASPNSVIYDNYEVHQVIFK